MSPRSSNGSEDASSGAPRSAVPVSHLCTCQAKLVGEAGDCHCRVAPQIVRFPAAAWPTGSAVTAAPGATVSEAGSGSPESGGSDRRSSPDTPPPVTHGYSW